MDEGGEKKAFCSSSGGSGFNGAGAEEEGDREPEGAERGRAGGRREAPGRADRASWEGSSGMTEEEEGEKPRQRGRG